MLKVRNKCNYKEYARGQSSFLSLPSLSLSPSLLSFLSLFREYIVAAAVVLALIAISNVAVVGLMARNIFNYKEEYSRGQPAFAWGIVYW